MGCGLSFRYVLYSGGDACTFKGVARFTFGGGARFGVLPVEEEAAGLQAGAG